MQPVVGRNTLRIYEAVHGFGRDDLAVQRVALRVKQGGHNIPTDDIHRRFRRSLSNLFELYLPLSDRWSVLDNANGRLETIASGTSRRTSVKDSEKWLLLRSIAP